MGDLCSRLTIYSQVHGVISSAKSPVVIQIAIGLFFTPKHQINLKNREECSYV